MSAVIQSLWIGERLSQLETLSIRSFLHHGHEYRLYTYGEIANPPAGVELEDANQILPAEQIFRYREHRSYSGFSNLFRYRLLLERGGYWVDTDVVCLRPFRFPAPQLFASEPTPDGPFVTTAVIKAPPGSPAMARAWEVSRGKSPEHLQWGETGPRLLARIVDDLSLGGFVLPPAAFCPLAFDRWELALDPLFEWSPEPSIHAIHLWNEMWRRSDRDKDAAYHPACLFERLKALFPER